MACVDVMVWKHELKASEFEMFDTTISHSSNAKHSDMQTSSETHNLEHETTQNTNEGSTRQSKTETRL